MTRARLAALVPLALIVAACSGGTPEQVQSAYDACYRHGGDNGPILKIDGNDLVVDVQGPVAQGLSKGEIGPSMLILFTVDCVAEQAGFPGKGSDLKDGDTWDGWAYSYTEGAGSSFTMRFTAK